MKIRQQTKEKYQAFLANLAVIAGTHATYDELHSIVKDVGVSYVLITACEKAGYIIKAEDRKYLVSANLSPDTKTLNMLLSIYENEYEKSRARQKAKINGGLNGHSIDAQLIRQMHSVLIAIAKRLAIKIE